MSSYMHDCAFARRMIIYLGLPLPTASSDLPESRSGKSVALCLVLLRMGFTCALLVTSEAVVSYTAIPPLPKKLRMNGHSWRYISVALALESPLPDVIRHPALWSPDFPHLPHSAKAAIICHSGILSKHLYFSAHIFKSFTIPEPLFPVR